MADNSQARRRNTKKRADREAFFVLVETGDGVAFFNASEHIGRAMPFAKPQATCAMRAAGDVVAFSLLRLTKANASTVADKPISIPRGPLARLERRAESYKNEALDGDKIIVEISTRLPYAPREEEVVEEVAPAAEPVIVDLADLFADDTEPKGDSLSDLFDGDTPAAPTADVDAPAETPAEEDAPKKRVQRQHRVDTYECTIRRDENNVAFLEEDGEDTILEVPRGAMHVSVYLRSPAVDRVLALSFIGAIGKKPGTSETVARVASMALNTATKMTEFRVLSAIESVSIPAGIGGSGQAPITRRGEDRAEFPIKLFMFSADAELLTSGTVVAEIDLENANSASGRLLVKYTPEEAIAELFPHYRTTVDNAVGSALREMIGDDQIAEITYDIILGSVDDGTVERLREAGREVAALDVTPTSFRKHL